MTHFASWEMLVGKQNIGAHTTTNCNAQNADSRLRCT